MSPRPKFSDLIDRTDLVYRVTCSISRSQYTPDGFIATHSYFRDNIPSPDDLQACHDEFFGDDTALSMEIEKHVLEWTDQTEGSPLVSTSSCLLWAIREMHRWILWGRKNVRIHIIEIQRPVTNVRDQLFGKPRKIVSTGSWPKMVGHYAIDHLVPDKKPYNYARSSSHIVWFGVIPASSVIYTTKWSATVSLPRSLPS